MGVKVAGTCLHWSQPPVVSQSPSSASTISSSSLRRRNRSDRALICHLVHGRVDRSPLFGQSSIKLLRSVSCDDQKLRARPLRRASSASLDGFSDEEFSEEIRELALRFYDSEEDVEQSKMTSDSEPNDGEMSTSGSSDEDLSMTSLPYSSRIDSVEPPWLSFARDSPDWAGADEIISANIERKANSVDLPFSLRIIKKKSQLSDGFREAGESAYCSVKKAFSSMVFIIRELHSYTLQMRELLYYEDLQGVLARVQQEMHASFVWLFQQIFSHTPTLMVSVMILLANFTVHSMGNNIALAAPLYVDAGITEMQSCIEIQNENQPKFDSSAIKSSSVSSSSGKTTSVGGNNGGGGKTRQIASGTDGGDGRFDGVSSFNHHQIIPDEVSQVSSFGNPTIESGVESESRTIAMDEEIKLWISMVDEASVMQSALMDEALDHETMQQFVSPITVEIEPEDHSDYFKTELMYQQAVSQEPKNALLLSNYAQFLYLVVHDHGRAEDYFKQASQVKPADAEALSKYATFLWVAKKDLEAAEETYLEAIEADPGNAYHAANYAHFLWNTGGEDTCYPLGST